ncbi:MAG TPA: nucleotidyltransferase [Vicinamibacteria bacterium]|nr:nucleotidyltransferase [Vicinamibacteria bacterium]
MRHHFRALLQKVNPCDDRMDLASTLPSQVRDWLNEHDYETTAPHSRLIGSYGRNTAILNIKDVDILLFMPEYALDRTPNAILLELRKVLADYPDTTVNVSGQRRSIRLEFPAERLHLDIVPAVLSGTLDEPLKVPDRPLAEWIDSDPLGYGRRLSRLNRDHGEKVVPLVKLVKAWRDAQMKIRRPKSYVLEVMVVYAVEGGPCDSE